MSSNPNKRQGPPTALAARLGADKKKVIVAVCLISVMAIMWLKVIFKKGPEAAAAVVPATTQPQLASALAPAIKVTYKELPVTQGRNNIITRNVFAANGWQGFNPGGTNTTPTGTALTTTGGKTAIESAAKQLIKLEALVVGPPRQAMINGKLLSQGDKLLVGEGTTKFEFEVIVIKESSTSLKCANVTVTLELVRTD